MAHEATWWIAATYLFWSLVALLLDGFHRTSKWLLHTLLWVNFLGGAGFFLTITHSPALLPSHNPLGPNHTEVFSILLLVALFSVTIEIPGFLLNSRYDRATIRVIDSITGAILDLRLEPSIGVESLEKLITTNRDDLVSLGVSSTLEKAAGSFKRMGNVDTSLLDIALYEIRTARTAVDGRSKHPLPALIQVFGLSGLAFVLGEILAALRAR
jgi:hypothetical protein